MTTSTDSARTATGRVAGKRALITGAAQGLGAAAARRLVEEGARVAITDINLDGAQAVAAELVRDFGAGAAVAFALDVTDEAAWVHVLADAAAALGGLSVLVHNAGIVGAGDIETLSLDTWRQTMAINVDSIFLGSKHAIAHLRAHQPGSIIVMSSIAGIIAAHNLPAYNASKAAAWMLSKAIALHCAKLPGSTCAATRSIRRSSTRRSSIRCARVCRRACSSRSSRSRSRSGGSARRARSPTPCSTSRPTRAAS